MLGRDGVDLCEADVGGVEAVCLVNFGDSLVSWLCEDDVDALHMLVNLSFNANFGGWRTYRVQSCTVNGEFYNLDCSLVACLYGGILGQRHLRETDGSGEGIVGGTEDLEHGDDRLCHVRWAAVRAVVAKAHVHVGEGCLVAAEPAGLECDSAASCGPVCSVCRDIVTAA